ncbi:MAG TPA: hypothetical protein VGZ00_03125 [Candidatus Baltobacteraceae bacterium]|nr:hypothetical protein [Candidatus Baltobacteraceae bacterium]
MSIPLHASLRCTCIVLYSGTSPTFPIGATYNVQVVQTVSSGVIQFAISVNGSPLMTGQDPVLKPSTAPLAGAVPAAPYTSGSLGLYCEDSHVTFGAVTLVP